MSLLNSFSPGGSEISLASDFTQAKPFGVFVGGAGDVKLDTIEGDTITVPAIAGQVLPWAARKVYATANGTTATRLFTVRLP